jgi:isoquinoline 1-oxidoreductase subunit beta
MSKTVMTANNDVNDTTNMTQTSNAPSKTVSRRTVLTTAAAASAGLGLGIKFGVDEAVAQKALAVSGDEVGAWVYIKPNDEVVIRIARSEMGQGTMTGLAQLVAEELQCDWSKVKTEFPTPGQNLARSRAWGDMSTGGSRGIRGSHDYVRQGGAAARTMLIQAAADGWKVPVAECSSLKSVITHAPTGKKTTYGKVASAAAKLPVPDLKTMALKDPKTWTIAGQPLKRLDTADKLTGKQIYGIDLMIPGMLNAAIMDAPVFGNKLKSFDEAKVKAMPGVRHVLKIGETAVAVVADTWWQAKTGVDALNATWVETENNKVSSATIAAVLKEGLSATNNVFVGNKVGDADAAIAGAAKKIDATYDTPFLHHVTMEPMNCTARFTADKCEVWVPTQNGEASLAACAEASGLPPSKCEVYKLMLGGGFGRRGFQDYVTKAVLAAKQLPGIPIKMVWTREEDMRQGRYRPITQCKMSAGLDDKGNLVGFKMRISGQSILASAFPSRMEKDGRDPIQFQGLNPQGPEAQFGYTIPNLLIDHAMRNPHVPAGFWRGVNNNQNAVYLECFMDEIAKAAGQDPLEFRRKMMSNHPKHLAVLNAVAAKIGWGTPPPAGQFRGIAQQMGYASYVAAAAEVSVSDRGKVKVHRLVLATDCGHAVNPDQIEAQVQGSVAYGLGAAFYQAITIKDGAVVEQNLDTYEIMSLAEFPKIETIVMPSGGFWGGVGEPTICVAAPAVLNAIYAATGKPVQTLPLKNVKL